MIGRAWNGFIRNRKFLWIRMMKKHFFEKGWDPMDWREFSKMNRVEDLRDCVRYMLKQRYTE